MAFLQKPQICQHGPPTTVDFLVKPLEKAKAGKSITTKLSYETLLVQWGYTIAAKLNFARASSLNKVQVRNKSNFRNILVCKIEFC